MVLFRCFFRRLIIQAIESNRITRRRRIKVLPDGRTDDLRHSDRVRTQPDDRLVMYDQSVTHRRRTPSFPR